MKAPEPLVIRRSLSNWNFIFQSAFAVICLGYAYAKFAQWPGAMGRSTNGDYVIGAILAIAGGLMFFFVTLRAMFDRTPLLQIDSAGIRSIEIGNRSVPLHEIGGCRFERISEGRSYYWYFFFTQTDAATGLKINFKISADEFDQENDDVLALIEEFKAADRTQPRAKPRPATITNDLTGNELVVAYSAGKELRAVGIYFLLALIASAIAASIGVFSNPGFFFFWQLALAPWETFQLAESWVHYFTIIAFVLAAFGSFFRIRDLMFRKIALRADRQGLTSADLGEETIPWKQIARLSFDPYDKLKVVDMSAGHPVDTFISVGALTLTSQEIYDALCWLLAHYKVKFLEPWEMAPQRG